MAGYLYITIPLCHCNSNSISIQSRKYTKKAGLTCVKAIKKIHIETIKSRNGPFRTIPDIWHKVENQKLFELFKHKYLLIYSSILSHYAASCICCAAPTLSGSLLFIISVTSLSRGSPSGI